MDPAWSVEGMQEINALAEELSGYDSFWETKSQFCLMTLPLWGGSHSKAGPMPKYSYNTKCV